MSFPGVPHWLVPGPFLKVPHWQGMGYPPARSGWGYPQVRMGYPQSGQDGVSPPDRLRLDSLCHRRTVRLLRFPAGGLSCFFMLSAFSVLKHCTKLKTRQIKFYHRQKLRTSQILLNFRQGDSEIYWQVLFRVTDFYSIVCNLNNRRQEAFFRFLASFL